MNEIRERLTRCFSVVFPQLPEEEIQGAAPTTVESWDSVATITLVSVIEEEFSIQIELEDIEHLVSFEMVLAYLNQRPALKNHI